MTRGVAFPGRGAPRGWYVDRVHGRHILLAGLVVVGLGILLASVLSAPRGMRPGAVPQQPTRPVEETAYTSDGHYRGARRPASGVLPNLIVLALDGVRDDCLEPGPDAGPAPMPFFASLGARGSRLTEVTSPSPGTLASLTSLLTGLRPDEHGVDDTAGRLELPAAVLTFAEMLSAGHGYETVAWTSLPASGGVSSLFQGFGSLHPETSLADVPAAVRAWKEQRNDTRPFFLFVQTEEATAPYGQERSGDGGEFPSSIADPGSLSDRAFLSAFLTDAGVRAAWLRDAPEATWRRAARYAAGGYAQDPDPALAAHLRAAYHKGVGLLDGDLLRTVEALEAGGLLENTWLVVTSSHGEGLGEHGVLGTGRSLHEEFVHVPLILVSTPPLGLGGQPSTSVGLIDLLPMFLESAGLPARGSGAARSMASALERNAPGRAVLTMEQQTAYKMGRFAHAVLYGVRTSAESYLIRYDVVAGTIVEQFFDRRIDPREENDLALEGRLGSVAVSAALAEGIESVRNRIWRSADATGRLVQMGYGAGIGRVTSPRPPRPTIRAP